MKTNDQLLISNDKLECKNLVKAIIVGNGEEVNFETLSVYDKPYQEGNIVIKAVVLGNGKLTLKGNIKIEKGADGVNAFLRQNVLVIGEKAQATAEPILEIETDEVHASHAATVGQVDSEQLFYLTSKGLTESQAKVFIVQAFLAEAIERMEEGKDKDDVMSRLRSMIEA